MSSIILFCCLRKYLKPIEIALDLENESEQNEKLNALTPAEIRKQERAERIARFQDSINVSQLYRYFAVFVLLLTFRTFVYTMLRLFEEPSNENLIKKHAPTDTQHCFYYWCAMS